MSLVATPSRAATAARGPRLDGASGRFAKGLAGVAITIAAWEAVRAAGIVDREVIPSFFTIASQLADGLQDGMLLGALGETLQAAVTGLLIAVALGVPAGFLIGSSAFAERATRPLIEFIRPIPSVAFIPVAIIVLGLGFRTEVLVVAFASFWLVLFNTKAGVEGVDPRFIETARSLRIPRAARLVRITLPAALPSIATGLRLAASTSLVVAISAEILIGGSGLGFYLENARLGGRTEVIWAGALAAGIVGYLLNVGLLAVERRVLRWSVEYRDEH